MIEESITTSQPALEKRSWFLVIATVAFFVSAGFSLYFQFQNSRLQKQIDDLNASNASIIAPLSGSSSSAADALASSLSIKSELQKIETTQFKWSKIIEKIENTIPKVKGATDGIVIFQAYNGASDGTITVNAATRSGSTDPFADTALTIQSFAADPAFKNVFVPSVTKSIASDSSVVLNFSLNFSYNQQNF